MNLDKLTMDELISLRNEIQGRIHSYTDGYLYICSVRQFGSVWEERPSSLYGLKELCDSYYGDNGIVDVYTNNYDTTQSLSNSIRNRLDRFVGTVNDISVQTVKYMSSDSQAYNADLNVYWMSIDFC